MAGLCQVARVGWVRVGCLVVALAALGATPPAAGQPKGRAGSAAARRFQAPSILDPGPRDSASLSVLACPEEAKLVAADAGTDDQFGVSVDIEGDVAVVGSWFDSNASGSLAGAVYVFVWDGSSWTEDTKLIPPAGSGGALFGCSVSLSGDTLLVGARHDTNSLGHRAGAAYVFVRSGAAWIVDAKLEASDGEINDGYGNAVALDGDLAVVGSNGADSPGAPDTGAAYAYQRSAGAWADEAKLTPADADTHDALGYAVAVSGTVVLVGSYADDNAAGIDAGSAYIFERSAGAWVEAAKLVPADAAAGDRCGTAASLVGDMAVVGARFTTLGGLPSAGAVYVFERVGGVWGEQAVLTAATPAADTYFGQSVVLTADDTLLVSAYGEAVSGAAFAGRVHCYTRTPGGWAEQPGLTASDAAAGDGFGVAVASWGDTLLVGALGVDVAGHQEAGAAYVITCENQLPECDAGLDQLVGCDGIPLHASASDGDGDELMVHWTSSCPDAVFAPSPDVLDPVVTLGVACDADCELQVEVDDGRGGFAADTLLVQVRDTTPPAVLAELLPIVALPFPAAPPNSPASATSTCVAPAARAFAVAITAEDGCNPAPVVTGLLRVTNHGVGSDGACFANVETLPVAAGDVVEIRLVAPPCSARPAQAPRSALGVTSLGVPRVTGESVVLEATALDRCGNTATVLHDPTLACESPLPVGTCCPPLFPPASTRCRTPCGN